jgi:rubrerythrin
MRSFESLDEREVLALAISLEEEHARIFGDFADRLRENYPAQAEKFKAMRQEEDGHRHRLLEVYRQRFGEHIPLIRRDDIRGFVKCRPVWTFQPLRVKAVQKAAALMELEIEHFYEAAAARATDSGIRQLLGDLAEEERSHVDTAEEMSDAGLSHDEAAREKQLFALQVIQPGLAGLMDGSVSTLAPLFAAAFATHSSWSTFRVGLAASLGAGISMGFAEALSDDGSLTGRGHPWVRGVVCGMMTAAGGLGHTFPYLISDIKTATWLAAAVVCVELGVIAWVRHRFMDSPWSMAVLQIVLGGVLVFIVGILIGSS